MTKLEILRKEAIRELHDLDKKTDLVFDDEAPDTLYELTEAKSIKEINDIRFYIIQTYSEAIMQISEESINSFLLVDIKDYNDELMRLGDEFDKVFLIGNNDIKEEDIKKAKKLFEEVFSFYKRIQQNEKNLKRQGRKEFYGKIAPVWVTIFTAGWLGLVGLLLYLNVITFSLLNMCWIIGGWFVIIFLVIIILRFILYKNN